jgi:hypothetical protein
MFRQGEPEIARRDKRVLALREKSVGAKASAEVTS